MPCNILRPLDEGDRFRFRFCCFIGKFHFYRIIENFYHIIEAKSGSIAMDVISFTKGSMRSPKSFNPASSFCSIAIFSLSSMTCHFALCIWCMNIDGELCCLALRRLGYELALRDESREILRCEFIQSFESFVFTKYATFVDI